MAYDKVVHGRDYERRDDHHGRGYESRDDHHSRDYERLDDFRDSVHAARIEGHLQCHFRDGDRPLLARRIIIKVTFAMAIALLARQIITKVIFAMVITLLHARRIITKVIFAMAIPLLARRIITKVIFANFRDGDHAAARSVDQGHVLYRDGNHNTHSEDQGHVLYRDGNRAARTTEDQGHFHYCDGNPAAARSVNQGHVRDGNPAGARTEDQGLVRDGNRAACSEDHRKRERGGKSGRRKHKRDTRYILSAVVPPTVLQEVSPTDLHVIPLQAFTSEIDEEEDDVLQKLIVVELFDEMVSLPHSAGTGAKMTFAKMLLVNLG